ncbi:unnamed protein product [Ostreobium quekettii]|uniref:AAA+ ATPase domain-containing protein n=1 Tax=Ostreobium quekettii TaxID=121088 RepID=A0A8S1J7B7_9CHLO|nr:unnamed protein product [Ostreobium quekettii]|eukprot:evm.model.scf_1689.2 EVM.evm.TU.scf_1689.2   scf_1689:14774-22500(-)
MPFVSHLPSLNGQSPLRDAPSAKWLGHNTRRNPVPQCSGDRRRSSVVGHASSAAASPSSSATPEAAVAANCPSRAAALRGERRSPWAKEPERRREGELEDIRKIMGLLPERFRSGLESHGELGELLEIVMDLGRVPFARFPSGDYFLSDDVVSLEDLEFAVEQVGDFGADNRAGIEQTLHRISCMRNREGKIIGLTCRVGRNRSESVDMVADLASSGLSILLLGRPGVGKTTVIRGVSKLLADQCKKRVVIVDTSNEIGGDGDVPHPGIGQARRMQVRHPSKQHAVMIEAIENHMPEVIVIDEVGTELECLAAQTIAQRGVQLVATCHGNELENVLKNPSLADLVGGISSVTLSDEEARRRRGQKSVLERSGPPAFDIAIEMLDRSTWRVHNDLAEAVDTILAGGSAHGEIRQRDANGDVTSQPGHVYDGRKPPARLPLDTDAEEDRKPSSVWWSSVEAAPLPSTSASNPSQDEPWAVPFKRSAAVTKTGTSGQGVDTGEPDCLAAGADGSGKAVLLRLYLWGVDADALWDVLGMMQLQGQVALTSYLRQANLVLASKSRLKQGGWIRQAAQDLGVPMYCLKSSTPAQLARALQTFLTFQPVKEVDAASGTTTVHPPKYDCDFAVDDYIPGSYDGEEKEAMEEARLAIVEIVIPRRQPIELLPRAPWILKRQMKLAEFYNVQWRSVGSGNDARLRILPGSAASCEEKGNVGFEAAAIEARQTGERRDSFRAAA